MKKSCQRSIQVAKTNSTVVPTMKQRLKTMKQMRSMTAAAIIHSLIISWFSSVCWRSCESLCSLVSSMSFIEDNRPSSELILCSADAAAGDAADDVVGSFTSNKSRMLYSTSVVDPKLLSSFWLTHSTAPTSLFSTDGTWPLWLYRPLSSWSWMPLL